MSSLSRSELADLLGITTGSPSAAAKRLELAMMPQTPAEVPIQLRAEWTNLMSRMSRLAEVDPRADRTTRLLKEAVDAFIDNDRHQPWLAVSSHRDELARKYKINTHMDRFTVAMNQTKPADLPPHLRSDWEQMLSQMDETIRRAASREEREEDLARDADEFLDAAMEPAPRAGREPDSDEEVDRIIRGKSKVLDASLASYRRQAAAERRQPPADPPAASTIMHTLNRGQAFNRITAAGGQGTQSDWDTLYDTGSKRSLNPYTDMEAAAAARPNPAKVRQDAALVRQLEADYSRLSGRVGTGINPIDGEALSALEHFNPLVVGLPTLNPTALTREHDYARRRFEIARSDSMNGNILDFIETRDADKLRSTFTYEKIQDNRPLSVQIAVIAQRIADWEALHGVKSAHGNAYDAPEMRAILFKYKHDHKLPDGRTNHEAVKDRTIFHILRAAHPDFDKTLIKEWPHISAMHDAEPVVSAWATLLRGYYLGKTHDLASAAAAASSSAAAASSSSAAAAFVAVDASVRALEHYRAAEKQRAYALQMRATITRHISECSNWREDGSFYAEFELDEILLTQTARSQILCDLGVAGYNTTYGEAVAAHTWVLVVEYSPAG